MPPPRFAIDAQAMIGDAPTGVANYSINIARAIGRIDADNDYVLPYFWSPRRRRPQTPSMPAQFRFRRVPLPAPVTAWMDRHGVELAWDRLIGHLDAGLFSDLWARPLRHGGSVRVVYDLNHVLHPETLPDVPGAAAAWLDNFHRTADRMSCIVAISDTVRTEVIEHLNVEPGRIIVASPAADRDVFRPRPADEVNALRAGRGLDRDYVLHTGRLEPRKNALALISAFGRLPAARRGELALVLTGPGGWAQGATVDAIAAATREGLDVRWLGFVDDDDLARLYTGARAFAYPSRYEGFGMPVLEAMACGTPVVTSTAGALAEVTGDAALHVDCDDVDGLASAIERVLLDTPLRNGMIERGRARAEHYSWDRSAERIHNALLNAAGGR